MCVILTTVIFIDCYCREMGVPKPHLIVVPLPTLPNWERETDRR